MALETWINKKAEKILDDTREYLKTNFQIPHQELDIWRKDYNELADQYAELLKKVAALEDKNDALEEENTALAKENADLKQKCQQADEKCLELNDTHEQKMGELHEEFEAEKKDLLEHYRGAMLQQQEDLLDDCAFEVERVKMETCRAETQAENAKRDYAALLKTHEALKIDADIFWRASIHQRNMYQNILSIYRNHMKECKLHAPPAPPVLPVLPIPGSLPIGAFNRPVGMCGFGELVWT
ncbi:hypothetical protein TWF281_009239 [Arthrobotrys megalospora]